MPEHSDEEDPRAIEQLLKDAHDDLERHEDTFASLYKATDASIERYSEGTRLVLTFKGFQTVDAAFDRTEEVVSGLTKYYEDVTATVYGTGMYGVEEEEEDDRSASTVTVKFDRSD